MSPLHSVEHFARIMNLPGDLELFIVGSILTRTHFAPRPRFTRTYPVEAALISAGNAFPLSLLIAFARVFLFHLFWGGWCCVCAQVWKESSRPPKIPQNGPDTCIRDVCPLLTVSLFVACLRGLKPDISQLILPLGHPLPCITYMLWSLPSSCR